MQPLDGPLDALFDIRASGSIEFGQHRIDVDARIRELGTGQLFVDLWSAEPMNPGDKWTITVSSQKLSTLDSVSLTTDDGRAVGFEPSAPLWTNIGGDGDRLRIRIQPSRVMVGSPPTGTFQVTAYVPNLNPRIFCFTDLGAVENAVRFEPMPNRDRLVTEAKRLRVPVVTCTAGVSSDGRDPFEDCKDQLSGLLFRMTLASGDSAQPLVWQTGSESGMFTELHSSPARPGGGTPLIPQVVDGEGTGWFTFQERTAANYERARTPLSLDRFVNALTDLTSGRPPYIETRILLASALVESLAFTWGLWAGKLRPGTRKSSFNRDAKHLLDGVLSVRSVNDLTGTRDNMVHGLGVGASIPPSDQYHHMLRAYQFGILRVLDYSGPVLNPMNLNEEIEFPPKQPL